MASVISGGVGVGVSRVEAVADDAAELAQRDAAENVRLFEIREDDLKSGNMVPSIILKRVADTLKHIEKKAFYAVFGERGVVKKYYIDTRIQAKLVRPTVDAFQVVLVKLGKEQVSAQSNLSDAALRAVISGMTMRQFATLGLATFARIVSIPIMIDIGIVRLMTEFDPAVPGDGLVKRLRLSTGINTISEYTRARFIDAQWPFQYQTDLLHRWGALAELLAFLLDEAPPRDRERLHELVDALEPAQNWITAGISTVDVFSRDKAFSADDIQSILDKFDWTTTTPESEAAETTTDPLAIESGSSNFGETAEDDTPIDEWT